MTYTKLLTTVFALSLVSCVSKGKFKSLSETHQQQNEEFTTVRQLLAATQLECNKLKDDYAGLQLLYKEKVEQTSASNEALQQQLETLQRSSDSIVAAKNQALATYEVQEERRLLEKNQRLVKTRSLKDTITTFFEQTITEEGWDVFQDEMEVKIIIPRYFVFREKGSTIQKVGLSILDGLAPILLSNTDRLVAIRVRSDREGVAENWKRSAQRASILGEQLINRGIESERIELKGLGGMPDTYDKTQQLSYPIEIIFKFKS